MAIPPICEPFTSGENGAKAEAWPKPVQQDLGAAAPGRWAALWVRRGAAAPGRWAALWGWPGGRGRAARAGRTGSGDCSARMAAAAAAAMTASGCAGAGAARSLSRFRGCLAGALLGDCVGSFYEAHDTVTLTSVLRHVQSLEPDPGSPGSARTGGRGRVHVGTRWPGFPGASGQEGQTSEVKLPGAAGAGSGGAADSSDSARQSPSPSFALAWKVPRCRAWQAGPGSRSFQPCKPAACASFPCIAPDPPCAPPVHSPRSRE